VLQNFDLPADAAFVDAKGLTSGSHQVEVSIEIPSELEVVTRKPDVHRLLVPERGTP
jgi:YbbR domain-containing protein